MKKIFSRNSKNFFFKFYSRILHDKELNVKNEQFFLQALLEHAQDILLSLMKIFQADFALLQALLCESDERDTLQESFNCVFYEIFSAHPMCQM